MRDELESRWSDLGEYIREQRRLGQLSLRKLSEMAGVSNPYLSQIERGLRRPSAEILQQIARALSISAETLYVQAGILDPRDEAESLLDRILTAPELTHEQRVAMARIYQSFVQETQASRTEEGDADATESDPEPSPESDAP